MAELIDKYNISHLLAGCQYLWITTNNTSLMQCELCDREVEKITSHHLIPRQKNMDRRTAKLCIPCSKQVHALFSNKELKRLDTTEKLKAEEKIKTWTEWVNKKNPNDIKYHGKAKFHN